MKRKSGFVYLLVLLAAIAVTFFASTMLNLNQNFRQQVVHLAYRDISFECAYSVLSGIMARVYKSGWNNRFFHPKPFQAFALPVNMGTYDYYVEDSPGKDHQMDVYIQINLSGRTQLYFWRVKFHDELLDFSNHFSTIHYDNPNADKFPPTNDNKTLSEEIDGILLQRSLNADKARETIATLVNENDTLKIARSIGAPIPNLPEYIGNDDFDPVKSKAATPQISIFSGEQPEIESAPLPAVSVSLPVPENNDYPPSSLPGNPSSPFPGEPPTILPPRPDDPPSILPQPGNPSPANPSSPSLPGTITKLPPKPDDPPSILPQPGNPSPAKPSSPFPEEPIAPLPPGILPQP